MDISTLLQRNQTATEKLIDYIQQQDDALYETPIRAGKWSTSEQVEHLILTNNAITNALRAPKEILAAKFGALGRPEYDDETFHAFVLRGMTKGFQAQPAYIPQLKPADQKSDRLQQLRATMDDLRAATDSWTAEELSTQQLPHPVFQMLSLREFLYFNYLHIEHHTRQVEMSEALSYH